MWFVTSLICSRLQLPSLLFVAPLYYFLGASIFSLSVCYVTMQFLQDFHCFIIFLLCHSNVLGFYCSIFCLLRHYTISSRIPLFHYLFVISLLCSQLRLFPLLFVTSLYYLFKVSIISLAICFITSLLCSQLQNKCLEIEIIQGTGTTSGDRPMGRPKTS